MGLEQRNDAPDDFNSIKKFFEYIFDDEEGYAYLATKAAKGTGFNQKFFQYPQELDDLVNTVLTLRTQNDVYYSPSLFSEPSGQKQFVKGARVVWTEFDGNLPESFGDLPEPSLRIQSSDAKHVHSYWKLLSSLQVKELEAINRGITYSLDADSSSWDASQILRVPFTWNYKRDLPVQHLLQTEQLFTVEDFNCLPELPAPIDIPIPDSIPPVEDVIAKHVFSIKTWTVFRSLPEVGDRSTQMMYLGYALAEMGLSNEEILSCLLNVDARWHKFSERSDQLQRLTELITKARVKYPFKGVAETRHASLGLQSLLLTEINLEWTIENLLEKNGYLLLSGPSGVGKTQVSLAAAAAMILGKPFLNQETVGGLKIGFFSLEMGLVPLKYFLTQQAKGYSPEELEMLEENFRLFPLGQPLYLNQLTEQARIEEVVEREGLDGIIIDSLGSTSTDELSQEGPTKVLMDWNDRLRQKTGAFTWFIHHQRKATSDNRKPKKLSDVYGSQYITARASTVMCLWPTSQDNTKEVIPLKVRLAEAPKEFRIVRDNRLLYTVKTNDVTNTVDNLYNVNYTQPEPEDEVEENF